MQQNVSFQFAGYTETIEEVRETVDKQLAVFTAAEPKVDVPKKHYHVQLAINVSTSDFETNNPDYPGSK